jgi:plasmid stabilization system protein ParE
MIKLSYTHAAQGDLIEYYETLASEKGEVLATSCLEVLLARCEDLARFPDMGRLRPEFAALGLQPRSVTQNGRLIVYIKRGASLHVVRIVREA